jgi:hypothetical protein
VPRSSSVGRVESIVLRLAYTLIIQSVIGVLLVQLAKVGRETSTAVCAKWMQSLTKDA